MLSVMVRDCPSWIGLYDEVLITGKQGTIAIVQSRSASNGLEEAVPEESEQKLGD